MRIGMITGEYPPMQGGVGAFTHILAREMAAQGHELLIYSRHGTRSDDPRIHVTPAVGGWGIGAVMGAARWARDYKLDLVNVQYQTAAYGMSPIIHFLPDALRPVPVITTFHDLRYPYLFPKAGRLRDWIVQRLARESTGVIVTNHEDAQHLTHPRGLLIPIGSNIPKDAVADVRAIRAQVGANADDFLIVFFGLINRSKGLDTLLESLARLRDEGVPAQLAIVGGAGSSDPTNVETMREIDALIERLELRFIVHKTGYLEDAAVSAYLAAADVVALPFADGASYRRGSLMAALEHGCATVTTTPTVAVPSFTDGVNLCLVPPGNAAALADALRHLYASPDERTTLKAGALELGKRFDWSEIARSTVDWYRRILQPPPRAGVKA
jgi:glycosyltransferase involved in cell wall biosynthesis